MCRHRFLLPPKTAALFPLSLGVRRQAVFVYKTKSTRAGSTPTVVGVEMGGTPHFKMIFAYLKGIADWRPNSPEIHHKTQSRRSCPYA